MKRNAVLICNPASGSNLGQNHDVQISRVIELLSQQNIDTQVYKTTGPQTAIFLARDAIKKNVDIIIANGGDGTLNEILQAMVGSSVPLAIWPGGTVNVLASDLELPSDLHSIVNIIANGKKTKINVGLAGERYFFLMAGIGLDASIISKINIKLKSYIGRGAYAVAALKTLLSHTQKFIVEVDGRKYESGFTLIGNSKSYGGGFNLSPEASVRNAEFDICIFPPLNFGFQYLPYAFISLFRDAAYCKRVIRIKGTTLKISPISEEKVWVQVDGDILASLPMSFSKVINAVSILL